MRSIAEIRRAKNPAYREQRKMEYWDGETGPTNHFEGFIEALQWVLKQTDEHSYE